MSLLLVLVISTVLVSASRYSCVSDSDVVGRELSCWVFCPALCLAQCLVDTQYMCAEELQALGCLYRLTLALSNFEIIGKLLFFFL